MSSPELVHISLDFLPGAPIMSFCDAVEQRHKNATYWMRWADMARLDVFMKISRISKIDTPEHFTKVLAGRIVLQVSE